MNDMRKLMKLIEAMSVETADDLDPFLAGYEYGFADCSGGETDVEKVETEEAGYEAYNKYKQSKQEVGGNDNVLGNDHEADFGGWPDQQR